MNTNKCSGVLLAISSLPGKYGIGRIGKSAYSFIDFLSEAGFSYWEILPICPTNNSNSPYQGTSILGNNTFLIDFDLLIEDELLNSRDFTGLDFGKNTRKVDYKKIFATSDLLLKKAFKRFNKEDERFKKFCSDPTYKEYAIYSTLKELNNYKPWYDWRLEDRYFENEIIKDIEKNHYDLYCYHMFTQFIFATQWFKLRKYAESKNIKIIGQIAHFIGYDSDEVYCHPERFLLDKLQRMTLVAGFPPDEFSKDGQKWGEPLYDWQYLKVEKYKWIFSTIAHWTNFYDSLIINHFSGFYKVYGIPFKASNGKKGEYIYTRGNDVIDVIKDYPIIASDLGNTDEDIEKYINGTGFPTLATICLPLFNTNKFYEKYLPSNLIENCVAYIGNHDNEPLRSRIENLSFEETNRLCKILISESKKLGLSTDFNTNSVREIYSQIIQLLGHSPANRVTFTMQDILYQGSECRMNIPGKISNDSNWTYRFLQSDIDKMLINHWNNLNKQFNR